MRQNGQTGKRSVDLSADKSTDAAATPELCASEAMETVPLVIRFMRKKISQHLRSAASVTQIRTLGFLSRFPGASLTELSEHLAVTKATASSTIERLVKNGFVDRAADPKERRCITLTITSAGAGHLKQSRRIVQNALSEVLSELPVGQLKQVADGLAILRQAFTAIDGHTSSPSV